MSAVAAPIYLDYAATTPVDPEVAQAMAACLTTAGVFGNPASSTHAYGREAAARVESARAEVAALIDAPPATIVFTSGATEADNLAVLGIARGRADRGRHLVTLRTEHKAVLDPCRQLEKEGFEVSWLEPDRDGRLDPEVLRAALRPDTVLVSVMHANNEIGVLQDLPALGAIVLECMNLPPRSDILLASNTYIATIIAVIRAGHNPILVEPDEASMNIDPLALDLALTQNTRGICVTHMYGKPCRMDAISDFAKAHDLRLIEDCAQSHGARFKDKWTGTFGDAGCFSFYPTKNLGGLGDGGAVITNDDALAERLKHVRNYGSSKKYVNRYVGVNSRLDELQAAALRVKLRHLDTITTHKRQLADLYFRRLNSVVQLPACHQDEFDVFHIFAIRHPDRDRSVPRRSQPPPALRGAPPEKR